MSYCVVEDIVERARWARARIESGVVGWWFLKSLEERMLRGATWCISIEVRRVMRGLWILLCVLPVAYSGGT